MSKSLKHLGKLESSPPEALSPEVPCQKRKMEHTPQKNEDGVKKMKHTTKNTTITIQEPTLHEPSATLTFARATVLIDGVRLTNILSDLEATKKKLKAKKTNGTVDHAKEIQDLKAKVQEQEALLEGSYARSTQLRADKDRLNHSMTEAGNMKTAAFADLRKEREKKEKLEGKLRELEGKSSGSSSMMQDGRMITDLRAQVARLKKEVADTKKKLEEEQTKSQGGEKAVAELKGMKARLGVLLDGKNDCKI